MCHTNILHAYYTKKFFKTSNKCQTLGVKHDKILWGYRNIFEVSPQILNIVHK